MLSRLESVQSFWITNANFEIRRVRLSIEETLFIATRNILKRNIKVGGKFFWEKMFLYTWFHGFAALNSHSNTVISKCVERNYRNSPFRTRLMKQNFSVSIQFYKKEMLFQWSHLYLHILRLFCNYEEGKEKVLHALCTLHFVTHDEKPQWWGVIMGILWRLTRWRDNLARETSVTDKSPRSRLKSTKRILGELKFILHVH